MPELPEVETVRRGLVDRVVGRQIARVVVRREGLRFSFPSDLKTIAGTAIVRIRRRAKYLLLDLSDGRVLLSHLGMSGRYTLFRAEEVPPPDPHVAPVDGGVPASRFGETTGFGGRHDHFELVFSDGSHAVYTDPRRFGILDLFAAEAEAAHPLLQHLGPEPFPPWDSEALGRVLSGRKVSIKSALLNQKVVVGVGNIYACEALHRAKISPRRQARTLVRKDGRPTERLTRLVDGIQEILADAIDAGGSTLNDFASVEGAAGYFSQQFAVYGRAGQPCPAAECSGTVKRIVQSNRSSFYCPRCQR
ncbi:MAG TPA: bifunctional DNA-formamidopyrimidine glycosylase/DNA-(apurinic or apyrimidinic site) lyase [Deltaproteobacteria bacterium]|nr:bifunctional DNA-formamidopyrimidine glycosylase/DNA-(apurinic or apyrimidinic site) lyase [Deltaproteobacteria bacterium]